MAVVLLRLRTEARTRWLSWLVLAVAAGLVGGATIVALAGARRTETAYPRFLERTRAFDVLATNGTTVDNINRQFDFDQVASLPMVADAASASYYYPAGTTPSGRSLGPSDLTPIASADGRFGRELNGVRLLEGRLPGDEHEVAVTFRARDLFGADVGQTLELHLSGPLAAAGEAGASQGEGGPPGTEPFRVVGMVAMQGGFPPATGGLPPPVLLSPAYARAHPDAAEVIAVRLHRGTADIVDFEQELVRLAGGEQVVTANQIEQTSIVQRSIGVQVTALRVLAALLAAVGVLVLGQAIARQGLLDADDHGTLRALGATGGQLRALALSRAFAMALGAAVVAAVTAVALSPLTPVGVARHAEPHPGVELNVAYTAVGAAAVLLVVSALGVIPAWWAARDRASAAGLGSGLGSRGRLAGALAAAGFPASAVSGVRMALEPGSGRSAVAVRSSIVSAALGVATISAVVGFSANLGDLFDDPRLYGWNWDVQIGDAFSPALDDEAERLSRHPAVDAAAVGTIFRLQVGRLSIDTLAIQPLTGGLEPTVVQGRPPRGPDEILLGTRTLKDLGVGIGDTVTVGSGDRTSGMRVVGRGVLTDFSGAARLGEGAAVTLEGMRQVVPDAEGDVVLLRLRPGAGGGDLLAELLADPPGNPYLPTKPSDLADLERVGGLPSVVAGLLGVMAVATLAHTLLTSVRRRRRDLAILKVIGFLRRQVSATVAWQSTTVAIVAVVVGVPLGVAAGRWAWQLFADRLGVPPESSTPAAALAVLVPATLLLSNLVAALPARLAARTRPTTVLRAE